MQTPWGDIAVRDAHVHFFSHRFFSILTGDRPVADVADELGWQAPAFEPEDLADHWIEQLNWHGVSSAALISSIPGDEDSVARAVARHPDRLHGQFLLNPLAPDAADRIRAAFIAGFRTVCLFPAMHRYSLADERMEAIWNAASGRNVLVHCGVLSVGIRKKLGLPSLFDMRFANPIDLHYAAIRHPSVRFVIPHFGAGYLRETLMLADLCPNVYIDTSSSNDWLKYNEANLTLEDVFRKALHVCGPQRLLFGTDSSFFPRGWVQPVFARQVEALQNIGVNAADAAAILGGNFEAFYA